MNYKIEGAIRRNRVNFIICGVLWIIITIVLIVPFSYAILEAMAKGTFDFQMMIETFVSSIQSPISALGKLFSKGGFGIFLKSEMWFSLFYLILFFIGIFKTAPKNEFSDIEHGSSDWSKSGEQYKVLSNKKGIILAEENYLPIDKRGNVNVLVVGRIRIW